MTSGNGSTTRRQIGDAQGAEVATSPHADDEILYGGNVVFATKNRGDTWQIASPDLTRGKPGPNDRKAHTITTIAASPLEWGAVSTMAKSTPAVSACRSKAPS